MHSKSVTTIVIFTLAILASATKASADVYRWVDEETGEIFFAEEPPSPEVTTEYENITPELKKRKLYRTTPRNDAEAPVDDREGATQKRQKSPKTTAVASDEELLLQHRCKEITNQIGQLEQQLQKTTDPNRIDQLIIELAEQENQHSRLCN